MPSSATVTQQRRLGQKLVECGRRAVRRAVARVGEAGGAQGLAQFAGGADVPLGETEDGAAVRRVQGVGAGLDVQRVHQGLDQREAAPVRGCPLIHGCDVTSDAGASK